MTSTPKAKIMPKTFLGILPNHLTYFRMAAAVVLPFLILSGEAWIHLAACLLFIIAAFSDYMDGWMARRYGLTSESGKWLDPLGDKMLVLGCIWAFSRSDQILSHWFFVAVLIREVVVTFCRTGWMLEGKVFGAEAAGKWKLFFQTLLIGVAFAILLNSDGFFGAQLIEKIDKVGDIVVSAASLIVLILTWYSGVTFLSNHRSFFNTPFFAKYVLAAGVGLLPKAPGTWGSIVGVILAAAFHSSLYLYWCVFLGIVCIAYIFFERFKDQFDHDPSFFVLDEVCGIFVTFALTSITWQSFLPGFLLFRLFDIWKPFPIKHIEKLPGFRGIMADDLLAGVYAAVVLWLLPL